LVSLYYEQLRGVLNIKKRNALGRTFFPIKHKFGGFCGGFLGMLSMKLSGAGLLLSLPSTPFWRLKVDMAFTSAFYLQAFSPNLNMSK